MKFDARQDFALFCNFCPFNSYYPSRKKHQAPNAFERKQKFLTFSLFDYEATFMLNGKTKKEELLSLPNLNSGGLKQKVWTNLS